MNCYGDLTPDQKLARLLLEARRLGYILKPAPDKAKHAAKMRAWLGNKRRMAREARLSQPQKAGAPCGPA